jgi:hypothetical protein
VTVTAALALVSPLNAVALAVIVVVPGPIAVTSPAASTLATAELLEVQVTPVVTFCTEGRFALP